MTSITSAPHRAGYQRTMMPGPDWDRIPDAEWEVYRAVIHQARSLGIRFAIGGAFATAAYVGVLRNTKDLDLYVLASDRDLMKEATRRAGLVDFYDRLPYDRSWIYRARLGDIIVDTIWTMANHRADVDEAWLTRGLAVEIRGEPLRAIPVEELIWAKLYILQRDRSDWGDVLNLIEAQTESVKWEHLLGRLAQDIPLLAGALAVYAWLSPARASLIPEKVWSRVGLRAPQRDSGPVATVTRADLLDSRPWFHSR